MVLILTYIPIRLCFPFWGIVWVITGYNFYKEDSVTLDSDNFYLNFVQSLMDKYDKLYNEQDSTEN